MDHKIIKKKTFLDFTLKSVQKIFKGFSLWSNKSPLRKHANTYISTVTRAINFQQSTSDGTECKTQLIFMTKGRHP